MGNPLRVLFVDDEAEILDIGVPALRHAGFEVVPAVSGDIAEIFLQEGLPFDVLITDVVLPGVLDGVALAHRAKQFQPGIRVIYTTGFSAIADVRSRGAPFGEVLAKPWTETDLLRMVRSATAQAA